MQAQSNSHPTQRYVNYLTKIHAAQARLFIFIFGLCSLTQGIVLWDLWATLSPLPTPIDWAAFTLHATITNLKLVTFLTLPAFLITALTRATTLNQHLSINWAQFAFVLITLPAAIQLYAYQAYRTTRSWQAAAGRPPRYRADNRRTHSAKRISLHDDWQRPLGPHTSLPLGFGAGAIISENWIIDNRPYAHHILTTYQAIYFQTGRKP